MLEPGCHCGGVVDGGLTLAGHHVAACAAKRADGSVGIMLINKDGKNGTTVKISLKGVALSAKGARFDYGKSTTPVGNSIVGQRMEGLGTSFSIPMLPYTATVILIPKA